MQADDWPFRFVPLNSHSTIPTMTTAVTLNTVVHDPHMHAVFLKFLSSNDPKNFSRLLFLVSVDEFKKLVPDDGSIHSPTTQRVNYAKKIIQKYMDVDSFFYIGGADVYVGKDQTVEMFGTMLHHDLTLCSGLSSSRQLFADVESATLLAIEPSFVAFSQTKEFHSLVSMEIMVPSIDEVELQHATSSFTLERVLANRRLCCVFWLFLFKERTHGPLSFWMEATQHLLPELDAFINYPSPDAEYLLVHLGHLLDTKYFAPGASAQVHVVGELQAQAITTLQFHFTNWSTQGRVTKAAEVANLVRQLVRHVKETLQMNHFVRFIQSRRFHQMLLSPTSQRLCLSPATPTQTKSSPSSSGSSSDSSTTSLQDVFHVMNVLSHQKPLPPATRLARLQSAPAAFISGLLHFSLDAVGRTGFDVETLYALQESDHTLPDHLDAFFSPFQSPLRRSQTPPSPSLFHMTIGATDRPFYMVCLTRYVPITDHLPPLERVLLEQKNLQPFVLSGLCLLSRYPLFDAMRHRLYELHQEASAQESSTYTSSLTWRPTATQLAALTAPIGLLPDSLQTSAETLFSCLNVPNALNFLAAMLCERKVLLVSKHVSVLTTVAESVRELMRPLEWSHVFCPVLPASMAECVHCPTPFLFGVHPDVVSSLDLEDSVVIVDLDADRVQCASSEGAPILPLPNAKELTTKLQVLLEPQVACSDWAIEPKSPPAVFPHGQVASLCHASWLTLLADMEEFSFVLSDEGDTMVVFDSVGFLTSRRHDAAFYQHFLKTQLFSQYIATHHPGR
ncbi:unnamed protein product [Aphanomyces euteiches]